VKERPTTREEVMGATRSAATAHSVRRGRCAICGGAQLDALPVPRQTVGGPIAEIAGLGLVRCRGCGFEMVEPRPDDLALAAFYAAQDYTAHEPVDDSAAQRRAVGQLEAVAEAGGVLAGARVLDVGCGGGQLLAAARQRGAAEVCGVDPAAHAHEACRRQGLEVVPQLDDLGARRFDGIVMSHVLEHVPDVLATLAELRELLRPGGWLCLEVPNRSSLRAQLSAPAVTRLGADERHRAFPIHLSYFTPATLRRALVSSGFEVVASTTAGLGVDALVPARLKERARQAEDGRRAGSSRGAEARPGAGAGAASASTAGAASASASAAGVGAASASTGAASASSAPASSAPSASASSGLLAAAKGQAKRWYFGSLLGENLIVVARVAQP
jgi:SAM-dependent methyltransferase